MAKRLDLIELVVIAICSIFAVAISFYHVAREGELGLTMNQWRVVWAISENGFMVTMGIVIVIFSYGAIKTIFKYVFVPYFVIKLIYHFSCFGQIYLLPKDVWEYIWSIICVLLMFSGLLIFLKKQRND